MSNDPSLNSKDEDWVPLGTEKDEPDDTIDHGDVLDPSEVEDGPDEDYPDDDGELD